MGIEFQFRVENREGKLDDHKAVFGLIGIEKDQVKISLRSRSVRGDSE